MQAISTKKMVMELLKEAGRPLSILELISGMENKFKASKTKQQIRNALNTFDCRDIVRVSDATYDLLNRVVNGIYFRYTLTDAEIARGVLDCDNELKFIFNSVYNDDGQSIVLRFANDSINAKIMFGGARQTPRRALEGLGKWYKQWSLCAGDDVIIKVVDYDASIYEIAPHKRESRDEGLIRKKNKEVSDVLEKVARRIDVRGGWIDMLAQRVICEYSYNDECPPDTISRIAGNDKRFYMTHGEFHNICLKGSPLLDRQPSIRSMQARKMCDTIMQFSVVLEGIEPSIWRKIQVPSNYDFWDIHTAIQDAMGWQDCHLHEFRLKHPASKKDAFIGIPDEDDNFSLDKEILPGWNEPITEWFTAENNTARYVYDFGDGWNHIIRFEGIMPRANGIEYPRCIDGARACPPEDVGSTRGYQNFVRIIKDRRDPEHKAMLEWIGGSYDPEHFHCNEVEFDDPDERYRVAILEG
jgi:hypothetical protein